MIRILAFIVRRLLALILVMFVVVTVVFALSHISPYDPVRIYLGQHANRQNVAQLDKLFGYNLPWWQQYFNYVGGLLHGNLGLSEEAGYNYQPVWSILQSGAGITLKLGFWALLLALVVGLPVGLLSALKQNSFLDHIGQSTMMILYIVPTFALVPICQLIFGVHFGLFPVIGWGDSGWVGPLGLFPNGNPSFDEMVLPVAIYGLGLAGFFAKSFRSFMLEVLGQDYVRTARAKGLKRRTVVYLHACKNTLIPLASIVGPTVAYLIVGAFIIEYLFSIPGIAYITVTSVESNDFAPIEATTLLLAIFVVIVNMLTDIFYAVVDPRVKL